MSNRGIATVFFVIFLGVFIYEMETLKGDTTRAIYHVGNNIRPQVFNQPQSNPNEGLQAALALVVANQLSYFGEIADKVLVKQYPDLKDELRYASFETSVQTIRSTKGVLKFNPLKTEYKDDYDKLRARYEAEHPGQPVPE